MDDLGFRFTWHGHANVEVVTRGGRVIRFDPWFGNPRSPRAAREVTACDLLLVTHGHSDHVGDSLEIGARTRPAWPAIHELALWLQHALPAGADGVIGMNKGGTVTTAGLKVSMTRADHSGGTWDDGRETTLYLGEPAGFVVELEDGRRVYHAGDTNVFGDMRLIRELHRPFVAMLPIGGHYTMGPREAALAVELLGVRKVIPIHFGTFPILAGTPEELARELEARGLHDVEVLTADPGRIID